MDPKFVIYIYLIDLEYELEWSQVAEVDELSDPEFTHHAASAAFFPVVFKCASRCLHLWFWTDNEHC